VFTPQLMVTYDKLKADGKNFEILFISSDRSESSFTEYYGTMPGWFALPYKDERCIPLTRLFGVQGKMLIVSSAYILSLHCMPLLAIGLGTVGVIILSSGCSFLNVYMCLSLSFVKFVSLIS